MAQRRGFKVSKNTAIIPRHESGVSQYLSDVKNIPLLAPDEEFRAAKQENKELLIKSNLKFVISVANAYQRKDIPFLDIVQQGNIGLIAAADKFDPDKGFKFISYAVHYIQTSIEGYVNLKSTFVRIPERIQRNLKKDKISFNDAFKFSSLNEQVPIDDSDVEKIDMLVGDFEVDNFDDERGSKSRIYNMFVGLKKKELLVMEHYIGLKGDLLQDDTTRLQELAEHMGESYSNICRIKMNTIRKMKKRLKVRE